MGSRPASHPNEQSWGCVRTLYNRVAWGLRRRSHMGFWDPLVSPCFCFAVPQPSCCPLWSTALHSRPHESYLSLPTADSTYIGCLMLSGSLCLPQSQSQPSEVTHHSAGGGNQPRWRPGRHGRASGVEPLLIRLNRAEAGLSGGAVPGALGSGHGSGGFYDSSCGPGTPGRQWWCGPGLQG